MRTTRTFKMVGLIFIVIFAVACSQVQPTRVVTSVPVTPTASPVSIAETLAKQYWTAYETKNADLYYSLFSSDALYMDYGVNFGPLRVMDIKDETYSGFASKYFEYKITSSYVSADGSHVTLEGTYTDWVKGGNNTVSVPCLSILEIRDGKIVKESLYYNGAPF